VLNFQVPFVLGRTALSLRREAQLCSALLCALCFSAVLCCCNGALMSPKLLGFVL
jgi:hypothetical protein